MHVHAHQINREIRPAGHDRPDRVRIEVLLQRQIDLGIIPRELADLFGDVLDDERTRRGDRQAATNPVRVFPQFTAHFFKIAEQFPDIARQYDAGCVRHDAGGLPFEKRQSGDFL
ncbi:Uncharacterised protein [Bordetella pertussis]|nr:Uncharacterised protein [Bordetella pertussis]